MPPPVVPPVEGPAVPQAAANAASHCARVVASDGCMYSIVHVANGSNDHVVGSHAMRAISQGEFVG